MPTPAEARQELARRELARRAAARSQPNRGVYTDEQVQRAAQRFGVPIEEARRANQAGVLPERFRPRPAPPRVAGRGQARAPATEAAGALANFNRGIPLFDEAAAAFGMLGDIATGQSGIDVGGAGRAVLQGGDAFDAIEGGFGDAYRDALGNQRALEDDFRTRRPLVANFAQGSGGAATMFVPGGPAAQATANASRMGNAARAGVTAAGQGAIFGLADRGTIDERLEAGRNMAALSAPLGAALGSLFRASPKPSPASRPGPPRVKPRTRSDDVRLLREAGVDLTPGQRTGGPVKVAEDIAMRFPIVGTAIRGARQRGGESMNVAAVQRALNPIKGKVNPNIAVGGELVADAREQIGNHLNEAAARIPRVRNTPEFDAAVTNARETLVDDAARTRFDAVVNRYLNMGKLDGGELTGADVRRIESKVNEAARARLKSPNTDDQEIGVALREVVDGAKELLEANADPQTGAMLRDGRLAWANLVRVMKASEKSGADTFTPSQLNSAVSATEARRSNVATGDALMQDYARAAKRIMPDSFGNPGTPDATLAAGGLFYAGSNPVGGALGAAGLSTAAAPYFMMGRNIIKRVGAKADAREAAQALRELDDLIAANPEIAAPLAEGRAMLARLAAPAVATTNSPRPGPPRR